MKKYLKVRFLLVILTMVLLVGTTVGAAVLYKANQVTYTPQDSSWNVSTVDEALNNLYGNFGTLKAEHNKLKTEISKTLTNAGITTAPDASVDTMIENINEFNYKISNMGNSVILAATNVSGDVDIGSLFPNFYKDLSISNFIIVPRDVSKSTSSTSGSFAVWRTMPTRNEDTHSFSKSYDANTGILNVAFSHYSRRLVDCTGHCSSADAKLTVNSTFDVYICDTGNVFSSSKKIIKIESGTCTNNTITVDISGKFGENTYVFPSDIVFTIDSCSYSNTTKGSDSGRDGSGERSCTRTATPCFNVTKSLNNNVITVNITDNYNGSIPQFTYSLYVFC